MYRKIIIGFVDQERGREAVALARALADPAGSELLLADVYPHDPYMTRRTGPAFERYLRKASEAALAAAVAELNDESSLTAVAVPGASVAQGLTRVAETEAADLIVLGSSRRGTLGHVLLGGTGERVLQAAPCAVAVAPAADASAAALTRVGVVGVGYDGSAESHAALRAAERIAAERGARVHVQTVVEPPRLRQALEERYAMPADFDYEDLETAIRERVRGDYDRALAGIADALHPEGELLYGDPAEELARAAREFDLLVVGSRGYGPVRRVLLGGVSAALMRTSPCPLLVLPRSAVIGDEETPEPVVADVHD